MGREFLKVFAVGVLAFAMNCPNKSTNPKCDALSGIAARINSPVATDTLTYGSTVAISWIVDRDSMTLLNLKVSADNGKNYHVIQPASGITVPSGDRYQCMSYSWKIGSEAESTNWQPGNNQTIIRIESYTDMSVFVKSATFVVKK